MSPDRAEARAKAKAVVLEFYRSSVAPFHYTDEKWLIEHIAAALRAVAQDCAEVAESTSYVSGVEKEIAQAIRTRWGLRP